MTFFPDQTVLEALQFSEDEMIKDAIAATRGDPNRWPTEFNSGKQRFQCEANTSTRITKNEVQYTTRFFKFRACVTTVNYVFVIGQFTFYDTLAMTSDVTDLTAINYKAGRATTGRFTLRWNADELRNVTSDIQCAYVEVQRGNATL